MCACVKLLALLLTGKLPQGQLKKPFSIWLSPNFYVGQKRGLVDFLALKLSFLSVGLQSVRDLRTTRVE